MLLLLLTEMTRLMAVVARKTSLSCCRRWSPYAPLSNPASLQGDALANHDGCRTYRAAIREH